MVFVPHEPLWNQILHCRIQVMGEDHDPPPGSILPEVPGRKSASGEVLFHDGMGFFGLPAPCMVPADQSSSLPVHIRYDPEELVLGGCEGDRLKGKHPGKMGLVQLFPDGQVAVGFSLSGCGASIGDKAYLPIFSRNVPLCIEGGMPF